jgi:hypothetical protein
LRNKRRYKTHFLTPTRTSLPIQTETAVNTLIQITEVNTSAHHNRGGKQAEESPPPKIRKVSTENNYQTPPQYQIDIDSGL